MKGRNPRVSKGVEVKIKEFYNLAHARVSALLISELELFDNFLHILFA